MISVYHTATIKWVGGRPPREVLSGLKVGPYTLTTELRPGIWSTLDGARVTVRRTDYPSDGRWHAARGAQPGFFSSSHTQVRVREITSI